jgi:hypothetical protein
MAEVRQFTLSAFFGFRGRPMRVITQVPRDAMTREHWFAESGLEASLTTEELRMLRRERYLYDPETNTIHLDLEDATGKLVLDEAGRPVMEAERDTETGELRSLRFHLPQPEGVELTVGPDESSPGAVDLSALTADHRFDRRGRPTYTRYRDESGRVVEERFYTYDARGFLASVMRLSPSAALRVLFEYEVDGPGNWTTRRALRRDLLSGAEALSVALREIAYWRQ